MSTVVLMEPREFDFATNAAGSYDLGLSTVVPLDQKIDLCGAGSGQIVVRLHSGTIPTYTFVYLVLLEAAPTHQDPMARFLGSCIASAALYGDMVAPAMVTGFGNFRTTYVSAFLVVTQPPLKKPSSFSFKVSAELQLKAERSDWTPADIDANPRLWLDERGQVLDGSGPGFKQWLDQSLFANHFGQANPALQPLGGYKLNTWAAPFFDSSAQDQMQAGLLGSIILDTEFHAFAVVFASFPLPANAVDPSANAQIICDGSKRHWGLALSDTGGFQAWIDDGVGTNITPQFPVSAAVRYLVEWSYDGSTLRCRVNSSPAVTVSSGPIVAMTGTVTLANRDDITSAFFGGRIGSVLLFKYHLSDADALSVRNYLSSKYGVAS